MDTIVPGRPFLGRITEEDIRRGERSDARRCPLARMATRRLPDARRLQVSAEGLTVWWSDDPCGGSVWDHDAADFVRGFDAGYPVGPRRVRFAPIRQPDGREGD
jgi:hypothetical protein